MAFADDYTMISESNVIIDPHYSIKIQLMENVHDETQLISIRKFVESNKYDGPTKQGITISVDTRNNAKVVFDSITEGIHKVTSKL